MRILLTGSNGQLGNALHAPLGQQGSVYAPLRNELDLSNPDQVRQCIREFKPDLIINPAAYTAVDLAETEEKLAHAVNAEAPAIMAEEARKLGAGLVHYSTDYVFDGEKLDQHGQVIPYLETDTTNPQNVYGKTKLAGEQAIQSSGCRHLILRTSWVYSLHGKNFLLTILRLARERDQLRIVNDQWGTPNSAAWLAETSCSLLAGLQQANTPADWWAEHAGLYHFSAAGKANWFEFATAIVTLADRQNKLNKAAPALTGISSSEYPTPARRPHNSLLGTQKLQDQFALDLPHWQDCLQECMQGLDQTAAQTA
ncbi:dTDP-4-dehydrorhamnose reductase [Undibacterium sp. Ji50W]|uniref:dTDP-4-dehydrorhamnose reductase n=1 Tax=Undibacterium sp. Ji50W TaxID=3413041 RepID=UPI003BF123BE